jgi:hypothetical protein
VTDVKEAARFSCIATNGIHLHVAEAGPVVDGPPLSLLHSCPVLAAVVSSMISTWTPDFSNVMQATGVAC